MKSWAKDNQKTNKNLDDLVNNEQGQVRISYVQAVYFLNNGINGDTNPSLRKECLDDDDFMGIYLEDLEGIDNTDHFQLWFSYNINN